ncbi:hypothetical protein Ahia01_001185500 [Argonauta hians]
MELMRNIGDSIYSLSLTQMNEHFTNCVGSNFVRFAGLSGAVAIGMLAVGEYYVRPRIQNPALKHTYEVGNNIHLLHSAALLSVCSTRRPLLVGHLFTIGVMLFSGSCYYEVLTQQKCLKWVVRSGEVCLFLGWICIAV